MAVPNSFQTTADTVVFTDRDGDKLRMTADADPDDPIIRLVIHEPGIIIVPTTCIDELIQALQHLKQRALERAEQRRATITE